MIESSYTKWSKNTRLVLALGSLVKVTVKGFGSYSTHPKNRKFYLNRHHIVVTHKIVSGSSKKMRVERSLATTSNNCRHCFYLAAIFWATLGQPIALYRFLCPMVHGLMLMRTGVPSLKVQDRPCT